MPSTGKKFSPEEDGTLDAVIKQDSEPKILPTSYSGPLAVIRLCFLCNRTMADWLERARLEQNQPSDARHRLPLGCDIDSLLFFSFFFKLPFFFFFFFFTMARIFSMVRANSVLVFGQYKYQVSCKSNVHLCGTNDLERYYHFFNVEVSRLLLKPDKGQNSGKLIVNGPESSARAWLI